MKKNRSKLRKEYIAGLDIGSTKVCCVIARVDDKNKLQVVGIGQQVSNGLKNGLIIDMEALETSIINAVHMAEHMANVTIEDVMININGPFLMSERIQAEVSIAGHEVEESDIQKIMHQARVSRESKDLEVIHVLPIGYAIDGNKGIRDPRGMFGDKMVMSMHVVTAPTGPIRNLANCVAKCHLNISSFVVSAYASSLSTLVEDEKNLGCTLIDMGGDTTSIAVFSKGNMVFTGSIPIGGKHITSDIAQCLSTPLVHAERLKNLYGFVTTTPIDGSETILVPQIGETQQTNATQISKSMLLNIIQPRVEEIFYHIKKCLHKNGMLNHAGRRVILTGGACQLTGISSIATEMLGKQVRIARPLKLNGLSDSSSTPGFSTCAGLLEFAFEENQRLPFSGTEGKGFFQKVGLWLRHNV